MKTMTCKQLGGACDQEFRAGSFEEIAAMSKEHGREMFEKKDEAHLQAMKELQEKMRRPGAMQEWFETKLRQYDSLPDDE